MGDARRPGTRNDQPKNMAMSHLVIVVGMNGDVRRRISMVCSWGKALRIYQTWRTHACTRHIGGARHDDHYPQRETVCHEVRHDFPHEATPDLAPRGSSTRRSCCAFYL